jgi:RNase H-fold protein (predicted Holliday junction resolvase)
MAVLGISANSRVIGIAILQNNELQDYSVRLYKESWSDSKVERIIASLSPCIQNHSITHIALAIPHVHSTNKETETVISAIKSTFKKQDIPVSTFHQETLYRICPERKAKKKALMERLSEYYPELWYVQQKELRNVRRYYHKLFEAVAAACLLFIQLSVQE